MGFSQTSGRDLNVSTAMRDEHSDQVFLESKFSAVMKPNDNELKQQPDPLQLDSQPNKVPTLEGLTTLLTQSPREEDPSQEPEIDHLSTMEVKRATINSNFASGDMRYLHDTREDIGGMKKPDEHLLNADICEDESDRSFYLSARSVKFPQCIRSYELQQSSVKTTNDNGHESIQKENAQNSPPFPQEVYNIPSSNEIGTDAGNSQDSGDIGCDAFSVQTTPALSWSRPVSTRNETTQTEGLEARPTSSKSTMTEAHTVDCAVSTHGTLCKLVRHCGTTTTGPYMKKLRRAQRMLVEAKETSRSSHASTAAKWRKVLDRYRTKMEALTNDLAKKDELMGSTSSRVTVLRWEIKEALLAVRSSTSTKERLNTQCKLNAALMDVIESKSDNPTYSSGLTDPAEA